MPCGKDWNILEPEAREALECYKRSLTGRSCVSVEDQNYSVNVIRTVLSHKISDRNEESIGNRTRRHLFYILQII